MRLEQRTYIDRNGMATTDRTQGVRLLGPVGKIVDDDEAARLGLKQQAKTADKRKAKPEDKAIPLVTMARKTRKRTPLGPTKK